LSQSGGPVFSFSFSRHSSHQLPLFDH
jgi:hypothetical protein